MPVAPARLPASGCSATSGTPASTPRLAYDGEIRLGARCRTSGEYADWVFITLRQRNGVWTRLCLDDDGTVRGQGFGSTWKAANQQLGHSLHVRGIAAYRRLDSDESERR